MRQPDTGAARQRIILASGSPRRKELLEKMGLTFEVISPDVDERVHGTTEEQVEKLAVRKARAVAEGQGFGLVIAADTLVALGERVLGKPENEAQAHEMLSALSGKAHRVLTGVCILDAADGRCVHFVAKSTVTFEQLTEERIRAYIATGEPMDKAGAYGIQGLGGAFVKKLEGSFENVMGLPVEELRLALDAF